MGRVTLVTIAVLLVACTGFARGAIISATPDWTVEANRASERLGYWVHTAGDVNGDGYSDVLMTGDGLLSGYNTMYLYLGGATGSPFQASRLAWKKINVPNRPLASAAGDVNGDGFGDIATCWDNVFRVYYGTSSGIDTTTYFEQVQANGNSFFDLHVAPAGDVNHDGCDDVLLSNSLYGLGPFPCGADQAGKVTLFFGNQVNGITATNVWSACASQAQGGPFSRMGMSIAGAGDVDGDGYDDFLVGSPDESPTGTVRLFKGTGTVPQLNLILAGDQTGMSFGASVSTAGDVNGDGYADMLIGAPHRNWTEGGGFNNGAAYVYLGGSGTLSSLPAWFEYGPQNGAGFGYAVSTAGDLDGDGYAEIAVGAPGRSITQIAEGQVAVFPGSSLGTGPAGWTPVSGNANGQLGYSLSAGGDIDGDGLGELIVGLPGYSNPSNAEGAVWVYRGHGETPSVNLPTTFIGTQTSAGLGWSVSRAGDFNGDGYDDMIVGEPGHDEPAGADNGRILLYLGSASGLPTTPTDTATKGPYNSFGVSVACAGDVNGDGLADIVAGAHVAGVVDIVYGNASASLNSLWGEVYGAFQANEYFGNSVTGGDVNGDGYSDVIVGSPGWDGPLGADQGRVYLFLSPGAGGIVTGQPATQIFEGDQAGEGFGATVAFVGDVDRNGRGDVIVGSPYYDTPLFGLTDAGRITWLKGVPSGLEVQIGVGGFYNNDVDHGYLGYSVAAAGDLDDNGFPDFVAGAMGYVGGGMIRVFMTQVVSFPYQQINSLQAGSGFGHSVSAAGDVDGDGYGDLLVGAVFFDGASGRDEGRMYLWRGGPSGISPLNPDWWKDGGQPFANIGHVVAGIGDVNGDGVADVASGAPGYDSAFFQAGYVQAFLGNSGGGVTRPMWAVRPGGGANVIEGDFTGDIHEYAMRGLARSAAGRTTVRMQWENERADQFPPIVYPGQGNNWFQTAAPVPGQGSSLLVTQAVTGINGSTTFGWRARFRTKSVYFPTTPWVDPGTNGRRIADLRTGPPLLAVEPVVDPSTLTLSAPRPNPSSESVALDFVLPRDGRVALTVSDLQGRVVRRLAGDSWNAGRHRLAWDGFDERGSRVSAGIYFVTLELGGERVSQRVTRLR